VTGIIQRAPEEIPVDFTDTVIQEQARPYRKAAHLFRLHSWSPVFINPDAYQISPGVALMSQNDLGTLVAWAGYQWSKPDRSDNLLASVRYSGWYPELQFDLNRKYRNRDPGTIRDTTGFLLTLPYGYWQTWKASASVPLIWSSGAWNRRLKAGLFVEQITNLDKEGKIKFSPGWMTGIEIASSILRKQSYRDLFPKWGVTVNAGYFKSLYLDKWRNNYQLRILAYLPGFLPNSSIRILNSAVSLGTPYYFPYLDDIPRGQGILHTSRNYNFKIDYAFPVSYPDYHLSWLIYIKRIKANLFFDAGTPISYADWFYSTGLDLMMDYHLLRIGIELESGLRLMYFPTTGKPGFDFILSFRVN
jgi:hypothetical protein